jgi:hypothetical protein
MENLKLKIEEGREEMRLNRRKRRVEEVEEKSGVRPGLGGGRQMAKRRFKVRPEAGPRHGSTSSPQAGAGRTGGFIAEKAAGVLALRWLRWLRWIVLMRWVGWIGWLRWLRWVIPIYRYFLTELTEWAE